MNDRDVGVAAILAIIGFALVLATIPVGDLLPVEVIKDVIWIGIALQIIGCFVYLPFRLLLLILRLRSGASPF
jgi:hypothetical protein